MEIRSTRHNYRLVRLYLFVFLLLPVLVYAQEAAKIYSVKNGKMFIELGRNIRESSLDSFINQFQLQDLALKDFMRSRNDDSLRRLGWQINRNNDQGIVISKPLSSPDTFRNPEEKIIFTIKPPFVTVIFPAVNNGIPYGNNRFKNKYPFRISDSVVTFFVRNQSKASKIMLAGSFNSWSPSALPMKHTDSGWIATVKLGPGKYWYKFIIDGRWVVDMDNAVSENDGQGNVNSVYFRPNYIFQLNGYPDAKKVYLSGSFNNWDPRGLPMNKSGNGWQLPLYLPEGTHTYHFVVDGKWMADPANPQRQRNEFDDYNSVVRLGKPYVFHLKGYPNARTVELAGTFNNWKEKELYFEKLDGGWQLPYTLGPGNYEYKFKVDGKWITDPSNPLSSDNSFLTISPNHTFKLKGFLGAKQVYLAGDFNNWSPANLPMKKVGDEWVFSLHLFTGKVRYKFIVDGTWILDPSNKLWEQNEYGTGNSILWVEK